MMGAMHYLATHPEVQDQLRADPDRIPQAVEEFTRVFPPVVALGRYVSEDAEAAGQKFKAGDFLLINYASANRDPDAVDNPTEINVDRETVVHAAFGVRAASLHRLEPGPAGVAGRTRGAARGARQFPRQGRGRASVRDRRAAGR